MHKKLRGPFKFVIFYTCINTNYIGIIKEFEFKINIHESKYVSSNQEIVNNQYAIVATAQAFL